MRHRTHRGRLYSWDTTFEGVIPNLERRYRETGSDYVRQEIERYMASRPCPACEGRRLKPQSLAVTVGDKNIIEMTSTNIGQSMEWVDWLDGNGGGVAADPVREQTIARQILKEIQSRLKFLKDVGLDYLTLDRTASTLSGGEAQRIRLATQIGSGLMGVLYVCDEPSVGLHPGGRPPANRYPQAAARLGQHRDHSGARRGHNALRRPHHRPWPGRGRARRPRCGDRHSGRGVGAPRLHNGPVPQRPSQDTPAPGSAAPGTAASWWSGEPGRTT